MSKTERLAKRLADHGRHVFVYHQVWTNQVIYSLERSMNNNQVLQQLAFAGKKTLPASLRKDMWRPLLTASFPSPAQGLHAFRKLREYRKLHELHWENPNPDARKLPAKNVRSHLIMDQKANSIADLASVLREQEELGQKKQQEHEQEQTRIREELLSLAKEAEEGGLPLLEQALKDQEATITKMKQIKKDADPNAPSRSTIHQNMIAVKTMRLKYQKMLAADQAVNQAKNRAVRHSEAQEARGTASPDSIDLTIEPPEIFYHPPVDRRQTKKRTSQRTPLYTADGITIRWANPLDAEFASTWPAAVRHEAAGLSRYTAAPVDDEPVFATEDYIMRNTSHKYQALRDARAGQFQELDGADEPSSEYLGQPGETPAAPAARV